MISCFGNLEYFSFVIIFQLNPQQQQKQPQRMTKIGRHFLLYVQYFIRLLITKFLSKHTFEAAAIGIPNVKQTCFIRKSPPDKKNMMKFHHLLNYDLTLNVYNTNETIKKLHTETPLISCLYYLQVKTKPFNERVATISKDTCPRLVSGLRHPST